MSLSASVRVLVMVMAGAGWSSRDPVFSLITGAWRLIGTSGGLGGSGASILIVGTGGYCFFRAGGDAKVTFSVGIISGGCDDDVDADGCSSSAGDIVMSGACRMLPTSTLCDRVRGVESHRVPSSTESTLMTGTCRLISPQAGSLDVLGFSGLNSNTLALGMVSGGGFTLILGDETGEMVGDVSGEGVREDIVDEGVRVAPVGDKVSDL